MVVLFLPLARGSGWLMEPNAEGLKPRLWVLPRKASARVCARSLWWDAMVLCGTGRLSSCLGSPTAITVAIFNWAALCFHALRGREMLVLQQSMLSLPP